jgi:hypothetical protein
MTGKDSGCLGDATCRIAGETEKMQYPVAQPAACLVPYEISRHEGYKGYNRHSPRRLSGLISPRRASARPPERTNSRVPVSRVAGLAPRQPVTKTRAARETAPFHTCRTPRQRPADSNPPWVLTALSHLLPENPLAYVERAVRRGMPGRS